MIATTPTSSTTAQRSIERRLFAQALAGQVARRAEGAAEGQGRTLSGYAAVFYDPTRPETEIELWENTFERIMPGAFDRALAERQDVRCLFNHEPDHVLGRTAAGTLRLRTDATGLFFEADENLEDPTAAGVFSKVARGDVSGSSFSFVAVMERWTHDQAADRSIREVFDVDLFDVGPVTFPWYPSTSAGARSIVPASREAAEQLAAVAAQQRAALANARARVEIDGRWRDVQRRRDG